MPSSPTASVVICTRNRSKCLESCLNLLLEQTLSEFEVIVVDNARVSTEAEEIATRFGARYVEEPRPGLSRARNTGLRAAHTEVVAFLDDDCAPESDWLENLVREFETRSVMAVTGRIIDDQQPLDFGPLTRTLQRDDPTWFEQTNFGGIGSGGNMAFRKSLLSVWPGFDERLGRGCPISGSEENHAFFTIAERGYSIVYTPTAVVRHSTRDDRPGAFGRRVREMAASAAYMTLLGVETRHRWKVVRYALSALTGRRRQWRATAHGRSVGQSLWGAAVGLLSGPWLYAWAICRSEPSNESYRPTVSATIRSIVK